MMPRPLVAWTVSVLVSATVLGVAALRAASARDQAELQVARWHSANAAQRTIDELRRDLSGVLNTRAEPSTLEGDLSSRLSAALASRGLPASCIASLSPESSADEGQSGSDGGIVVKRRRAAVTLQGLTLPQLGAVLGAWREREPAWTVTRIDLTPLVDAGVAQLQRGSGSGATRGGARVDPSTGNGNSPGGGGNSGGGGASGGGGGEDLPLRAVLLLESVRIETEFERGESHRSIIDPPGANRVTPPAIHDAGRRP